MATGGLSMTKEQVLKCIQRMEWHEKFSQERTETQLDLERLFSNYVVYQENPETGRAYNFEQNETLEDALADANSRTSDGPCYVVIVERHGEWRERRILIPQEG